MTAVGRRIVVCGGGITGLVAAWRLSAAGAKVTLVEASKRLGGSLVTIRRDGLVIDGGADAFVAAKPQAAELCRELGLGDRLQRTNPRNRHVYFLRRGKLVRLPEGLVLAVPTRFVPLLKSPLFSPLGIARMGLDLVAPRRRQDGDESIASFLSRRLGDEAVEILGEPLLAGIFSGDPHRLSIHATFPQLVELERIHRSLVIGALAGRKMAPKPTSKEPPSPFLALRGGMGELTDVLEAKVRALGAEVLLETEVTSVTASGSRWSVEARSTDGVRSLVADRALLCCSAPAIARAVEGLSHEASHELRRIPQVSTAAVLLAYDRADVPHALDASGVLIPRREGREASAITFMSSKWADRAPDGVALLRVFLGGHARPEVRMMTNEDVIAVARSELRAVLGITAEPKTVEAFRWNDCRPQPVLGHLDRMRRVRDAMAPHRGLVLAGAAFDGVGISDCVRQANEAARNLLAD